MSNKAIIDIDINDEKFRSFLEAFQEWNDSLDDAPSKWNKLGEAMGSAGKGLEGTAEGAWVALAAAAASADDLASHLHTAAHAQSSFAAGTRHSLKGLNAMKGAAHDLGKTLFGIGKFLAGGIVMGGIGTALGGFGMADLAGDAMNRQRRARSLGVATGMAASFEANFMRVGNPAGMLQDIANAKNTLTDQPFLKSITGQIHGDTATMAYHAMLKAHDTWKSLPASARNTTTMNALGYSELGFTLGDMRVLARIKKSTLESDWAKTQKDQGSMALPSSTVRWQKSSIS